MSAQNQGKFKVAVYTVDMFLILAFGVAALIALNVLSVGWAWLLTAILFGVALFMLISHWKGGSKILQILKLLFPVIREDLREEWQPGGKEFVSVDYLAKNWVKRVDEKERDLDRGFPKEIHPIRESVQEGTWLTRLPPLVDETYQKSHEDMEPQVERKVVEVRPRIREPLKRVFKELPPETVERYRESRESNAYLLIFDCKRGNLAGLIDCFVSSKMKSKLAGMGIVLQVNGQPKYRFKKYARARIGIAPKGWTLQDFCDHLQKDLAKVIEARRELVPEWDWDNYDLEDIELMVIRLGLRDRAYYDFKSDLSRPRAVPNSIMELLAETLDIPDLVEVIAYE
jgi:hypothetical protein